MCILGLISMTYTGTSFILEQYYYSFFLPQISTIYYSIGF